MTTEEIKALDKRIEAIGWSLWFIWLGVIGIITSLPDGSFMLGTGLLLLGLNVERYRRHIPVHDFSLVLGLLALLDGGVDLLRDMAAFHIELEFFPVLLVIVGALMMVRSASRLRDLDGTDGFVKPKRGSCDAICLEADEMDSAILGDSAYSEAVQRA
jgi:hypothetical protein